MDDAKTIQLFARGDTTGIFQFESTGIRNVLRRLHPEHFEDIALVNALYRPGPMQNIDEVVKRKTNHEKLTYPDDSLIEILKPTYGVIVYQEQVMLVASKLAGFSLGQADILRRAMSKKKLKVMDQMKSLFYLARKTGAIHRQWPLRYSIILSVLLITGSINLMQLPIARWRMNLLI